MSGLNYKESQKLRRVPQMTKDEIINYYSADEVPDRFEKPQKQQSKDIINRFVPDEGHRPVKNGRLI